MFGVERAQRDLRLNAEPRVLSYRGRLGEGTRALEGEVKGVEASRGPRGGWFRGGKRRLWCKRSYNRID